MCQAISLKVIFWSKIVSYSAKNMEKLTSFTNHDIWSIILTKIKWGRKNSETEMKKNRQNAIDELTAHCLLYCKID